MAKKKIAIDIDDVIADSTESLRIVTNKRTGSNLSKEHFKIPGDYWGYYERVWQIHGIDKHISFEELDDEMIEDQSHVPLLPGASFALMELSKSFEVYLLTSRNKAWENATRQWLDDNGFKDFKELHFTESYKKSKSKGEICSSLGISWLVDDNPEHCQSAVSHGVEAILFGEYGWHHKSTEGLKRCKSWPEVLEYFNGKE